MILDLPLGNTTILHGSNPEHHAIDLIKGHLARNSSYGVLMFGKGLKIPNNRIIHIDDDILAMHRYSLVVVNKPKHTTVDNGKVSVNFDNYEHTYAMQRIITIGVNIIVICNK